MWGLSLMSVDIIEIETSGFRKGETQVPERMYAPNDLRSTYVEDSMAPAVRRKGFVDKAVEGIWGVNYFGLVKIKVFWGQNDSEAILDDIEDIF